MRGKNNNIPIHSKESVEIQTDVNLIENRQDQPLQYKSKLRLSSFEAQSQLLSSFSDSSFYREIRELLKQVKESPNCSQEQISKRLSIMEKQIEGLMKRDILINDKSDGFNADKSFYSALSQKDKELYKLEYRLAYNDIKVKRFDDKILQLQNQIKALQITAENGKKYLQENDLLKDYLKTLKQGEKKIRDIQNKVYNQKTGGKQSASRQEAVALINQFSLQLEKLSKSADLTTSKINDQIVSFFENNNLPSSDVIASNFAYKSKYQQLSEKYSSLVSTFKKQIQTLDEQNPSLKGIQRVHQLMKLVSQQSSVEYINISGWVGIGTLYSSVGNTSTSIESKNSLHLIHVLSKSLKSLAIKYPKVNEDIPLQIRGLLQKQTLIDELIESESISRLKQLVIYQKEAIRVDNVYSYNNKKDQDLIFHLRILIKSLLEELQRVRTTHQLQFSLDEGILQLLRKQVIQGVDIDEVLKLYRPLPKIVQVERIVQKPVYINNTLQKGVPVRTDRAIVAESVTQRAVEVIKQVPVYIQKAINNTVKQFIEVRMETDRIIEVPTIRDMIVEKIMINEKLNEVQVEKIVPLIEEKIVQLISQKEVVVEVPKLVQVEKVVQTPGEKQFIEIEKIVEKPIYLKQVRQKIKEVEVINEKIFEKDKYIEIEKEIPHIITNRQTVYLERQVPKFITNTEQKEVRVTEVIEKVVPYKVIEEKVIQVPVIQEKEIIRQVQKQLIVQVTHFIKGDRQQVIKEVEVIIEKPIREEVLITKDLQIQRTIPLYVKEQKPIYVELQTPYIQSEPRIINQKVAKIVPTRQEIIKQVKVEVPVPVIVQKQVVRVQTVFVEKIVQKIVEVPRVVEVQKIVEKIVVIPRIIQKIVQVPRIIQKIVTIQVPCLQIVQVIRQVPVIREVEVIKEVIVQKQIVEINKQFQIVQKEVPVEVVVEKQVIKEVQVQRRIPTEVIREVPVEVFKDRIVEKTIQLHEVTVKDRQVQIPYLQQMPVEFIVEKPVVTEKIVEKIVNVPQVVQRDIPITNTVTIPQIVEVIVEKAVEHEVIRQVPGPETIKYIQVPKEIEVLREKIVQVQNTIQVPRQVFLYMDKIVHEYHERLQPIHVPKIVEMPHIIEITKPQHFIHYKQVPVQVQTNRNVPVRTIVDQIKQVQREVHHQHEVQVIRERIKQIVQNTTEYLDRQVQKQLLREVVVNETKIETVQVPAETKIVETNSTTIDVQSESKYIEKIVERIVMMPQIVEVVKHFHQISQIRSPGTAVDVDVQTHTKEYLQNSQSLKESLQQILEKFRQQSARQPDLKALIPVIEAMITQLQSWIKFPKILEVPQIVEKLVQKDRIVLVPSQDHGRQASLSYLVEKLIGQLRRIRDRNRIDLQLDEDIMKLFFKDKSVSSVISQGKLVEMEKTLRQKYESLGQWKESYPFMVNSFLQDYFTLNSALEEADKQNNIKEQRILSLQQQLQKAMRDIISTNSSNAQILRNYYQMIQRLNEMQQTGLSSEDTARLIQSFSLDKYGLQKLYQILKEKFNMNEENIDWLANFKTDNKSVVIDQSSKDMEALISKISNLENQNARSNNRNRSLEQEIKILQAEIDKLKSNQQQQSSKPSKVEPVFDIKAQEQLKAKMRSENEQKIKNLQNSHQSEIERLKASQERELDRIRNQKANAAQQQLVNQIKKINQQLRKSKQQLQAKEKSTDLLQKNHERELENLKKQHQINLKNKESSIQQIQNLKSRITDEYEKKINQLQQAHNREMSLLKNQAKNMQAADMKDSEKVLKEVALLKERIQQLELELQTAKRDLEMYQRSKMGHTAYTSGFASDIKGQTSEIIQQKNVKSQVKIETYQSSYRSPMDTKKLSSPDRSRALEEPDQFNDSSSKKSSDSRGSERSEGVRKYKHQMTLKQFMDMKDNNEQRGNGATFIMIKIIEKIQEQAEQGLLHSFSPTNIYLSNLNSRNFEDITVRFGAPIVNKANKTDGLYLSPEILAGGKTTQKSIVYTLGVIWDELIHGDRFFKSMNDISNPQIEFKVRDAKLNPILKNTLFEMMNKQQGKRLQLRETKRRLSLQKYIASESRK